jgi:amino acid adenylation domain-containing protein
MGGTMVSTESFDFPCSFAQQRVWVDDQLAAGSAFYNIHASLRLPFVLQPALLERALSELVERHESLRTTFIERDGTPYQRVARTGRCDFAAENISVLPPVEREQAIRTRVQGQASQLFDLERGPLLRVRLLQTGSTECVLMLTIHHIVADAWSMTVLFHDLNQIYTAHVTGCRHSLVALPIQYADYTIWQRQPADVAMLDASIAYWRKQLADLPTLELPTDRARGAVGSHCGRTLRFGFDPALASRLFKFARVHALTPYTVLLTGLALVLQRNSGQDEVVIGAPVAGRDRLELESLIGFFVNMLVLRLDLSGEPSFADLVARIQRTLQEGLAHQSVPFERLVEELRPARDLSRNPLFQVTAQYLVVPLVSGRAQGIGATVLDIQRGASNFDLSFDFWPEGEGLAGRVDYSTYLFDEATVQRWVEQMLRILERALAQPGISIEKLELLSAEERARLLNASMGPVTPYPRNSTLAHCFAEIVRLNPDALAVTGHGVSWTYAELSQRSAFFAESLIQRGARVGQFIGVALPRGPDQVAAIVGILRLGCAYVALDACWPRSRLSHCLRTAQVVNVVCSGEHVPRFAELGVDTLCCADVHESPANSRRIVPASPLTPAYVAFTSGSTGEPKAVVVPHRAVLRLVSNNSYIALQPHDRMLVYAPLAFDASTLEVWGTLCNGACMCVAPPGPLGLDELAQWMDSERISAAWFTAGLFHQLAASHPASLARVRRLYAGGDTLGADAVRRVLSVGDEPHCVLNGYGPTENTTFTCVHEMSRPDEVSSPVPIGRPCANGYVRVLDARGRLAAVGVSGELLAGGDGVALGYLGDPDASARAFIPDPIEPQRGRVYRTGDRVRWRADGLLEFLGRMDRQVKVRGYRVEPGEIECALRALPGVSDARVLARADQSGDKHLAAYVAAADTVTVSDVTRHLGARLPAWMIPTEVYLRSGLQLGTNGKVDTSTLLGTSAPAEPSVATTGSLDGELESLIAKVWEEVLAQPIGRETNFFTDGGGHSLLATQAVSRLNAALGIRLPLAAIFEDPTPRRLAPRLEALLLADQEIAAS